MKSRILAAKSPKLTKAAPLGVSYNSEPETMIEILLKVAKEHSDVLKKPKPVVFLMGFGDFSINYGGSDVRRKFLSRT